MSTLLLDTGPQIRAGESLIDQCLEFDGLRAGLTDPSHGLTLDELITGVWEGLSTSTVVSCPACGGAMVPRHTAGSDTPGGACASCGAELD